jgi:serine/threonine protein kinase
MEYFPLGDLSKHISEEIKEYELKDISSQLLEGLSLMHSKGFTHRDLKPQVRNVFLYRSHLILYQYLISISEHLCGPDSALMVDKNW